MVDGWSFLSSFWSHELFGGWIFLLWIPFDGILIFELIWVITYPLEAFQVVYSCLPFSPFQWPFSPFKGWWLLTFIMRLFSQLLYIYIFIMSITIIPRIFKSTSFRLIGFWESWLFNYPLTFILYFLYPKTHGLTWDQGFYLILCLMNLCFKFQLNPLRKSKFIGLPSRVLILGINGGEGKWPRIFPNVLIWFCSDPWVTLLLPTCI